MKIKKQIVMLTMMATLLAPGFSAAMDIRQEMYSFEMAVARDVASETFILDEVPSPRTFPSTPVEPTNACHLPLVHFQKNSAALTSAEADAILSGLQQCRITPDTPLAVTGYTCALGPDHYNQVLSLQRARTVAAFLQSHGFIVATVQGRGSNHSITRDPQDFPKNRRVEIEGHH